MVSTNGRNIMVSKKGLSEWSQRMVSNSGLKYWSQKTVSTNGLQDGLNRWSQKTVSRFVFRVSLIVLRVAIRVSCLVGRDSGPFESVMSSF